MASILDPVNYLLMTFEEWSVSGFQTDRMIKTPMLSIPAPDVIVLKKYGERPPRKVQFTRPNLYRRDDYTCQYCGVEMPERKLTIEHILPRSRGGATSWENCVAACENCNFSKADKTPTEAGMRLKSAPARPAWTPKLALPRGHEARESWQPFLEKELVA